VLPFACVDVPSHQPGPVVHHGGLSEYREQRVRAFLRDVPLLCLEVGAQDVRLAFKTFGSMVLAY
jgi:hypothetical protein